MATKFLTLSTSAKTLFQFLQPSLRHSWPLSQFLRSMHSFVFRDFDAPNFQKSYPGSCRGMACAPNHNLDEAGAAMLASDNRVPATVITGFLGSGKVSFSSHFQFFLVSSSGFIFLRAKIQREKSFFLVLFLPNHLLLL